MNYYEHHIRDYDAATSHLTWEEDLAYTRLLRWYYRKEQPIPADVSEACRLVRATTKPQKLAVARVLQEFFVLEGDGWHQEKCDEAIAKFLAGEPEREVKKANEDNRLKKHRDERAKLFKALTDAGGHAPWNIGIAELRALVERLSSVPAMPPVTPNKPLPETAPATPATATQSPSTIPQTPVVNTIGTVIVGGSSTRDAENDENPTVPKDAGEWQRYYRERYGVELDATNVHDRKKAWPLFSAWCDAGVSTAQMDAAVKKARAESKGGIAFLPGYADRVLATMSAPPEQRMSPDEQRRAISERNGAAWLAGEAESDPNVIDMEH